MNATQGVMQGTSGLYVIQNQSTTIPQTSFIPNPSHPQLLGQGGGVAMIPQQVPVQPIECGYINPNEGAPQQQQQQMAYDANAAPPQEHQGQGGGTGEGGTAGGPSGSNVYQ